MIENRITLLETTEVLPRPEGTRQRQAVKQDWVSELGDALSVQGLLNPILIDKSNVLIAGEHRLEAFRRNARLNIPCPNPGYKNWTVIPCRRASLDQFSAPLLELAENLLRKGMHWQEEAKGIYLLMEQVPQEDEQTADQYKEKLSLLTGIKPSVIADYLQIKPYLEHTQIQACLTRTEAVNVTSRLRKRAMDALEDSIAALGFEETLPETSVPESLEIADASSPQIARPNSTPACAPVPAPVVSDLPCNITLVNGSFIDWADSYQGAPFNFVHCDFPYGVGMDKSNCTNAQAWATYEDSKEIYFSLIKALIENKEKLFSQNSFLMFWYSEKYGQFTREVFADAGFKQWTHPLIWHKSDNTGILSDYRRYPRHIYENALVFTLGDPFIVKPVADSVSSPATKDSGHVSEKPIPVLQHFFRLFVDEHTNMLDPTAGSHNALAVALEAGAASVTGIELDPEYHAQGARLLAGLSK